jgi:3-phosphoshikimate 1-carboxyvinyltransferase
MVVKITPGKLWGSITPPPSKSQAHRLIIAAALAEGESRVKNLSLSKDITATLNCMHALGAVAAKNGSTITGVGNRKSTFACLPELDCCESGSTLRFLIPVALAVAGGGVFSGQGRLMERPQGPYEALFAEKGIAFVREDGKIRVEGKLESGVYRLPGDVSSQFITGLLYALPMLEGDSEIMLTTPLESSGYVDMTLYALNYFGVSVQPTQSGWHVPGGQKYQPRDCTVESDYSQAAFFFAANLLGSQLNIRGLNQDSVQGDRAIVEQCKALSQPGEVTIDVSQCPDLVPPLAAIAALRTGERTNIVGAARLRIKESDRLDTVTTQLNALGADIAQSADSLTIHGVDSLHGGEVSGCNDHRIAMMLAMAATCATESVTIADAECVSKSYPNFWEDYAKLGGLVERVD